MSIVLPHARPLHRGVDHLGGERLAERDVVGVLLAVLVEVGLDEAERRQRAGGRVGEVLVDVDDLVGVRVEHGQVQARPTAAMCSSRARGCVCRLSRSMIVPFGGCGPSVTNFEVVVDRAERRAGEEEPAVGIRLRQDGTEPPVAHREGLGEPVVEGDVVAGPVAHRDRPAVAAHEAVVGRRSRTATCDALHAWLGWRWQLAGVGHVERTHRLAVGVVVRVRRLAVRPASEAVASAEHAEVVVVAVVLHHEHDHVLDLGDRVGALGLRRVGPLARRVRGTTVGGGADDNGRAGGARPARFESEVHAASASERGRPDEEAPSRESDGGFQCVPRLRGSCPLRHECASDADGAGVAPVALGVR